MFLGNLCVNVTMLAFSKFHSSEVSRKAYWKLKLLNTFIMEYTIFNIILTSSEFQLKMYWEGESSIMEQEEQPLISSLDVRLGTRLYPHSILKFLMFQFV